MLPTFVFDDHGRAYAMVEGKVVASADSIDDLETQMANAEWGELPAGSSDTLPDVHHTHIVTPNGLKGQILGKHKDLWGEAVTVRFENGRIASYHVADDEKENDFKFVKEEDEEKENPVENLKKKVEKETAHTTSGIQERLTELDEIKKQAYHLISQGVSYEDEQQLDDVRTMADHERGELAAQLEYLESEEAEAYRPPAPYGMEAVEQESLGGGDGTWLDETLGEMIQEAEGTDFDQMMEEGPETFVAELEDPALADAGVVRQMASNLVRSKTAGIDPEAVKEFEKAFLGRVEWCRRARLTDRKEEIKKEAASEENFDGPAEGLFM